MQAKAAGFAKKGLAGLPGHGFARRLGVVVRPLVWAGYANLPQGQAG